MRMTKQRRSRRYLCIYKVYDSHELCHLETCSRSEVSSACRFCGFFSIPHLSAVLQTLSSSRRKGVSHQSVLGSIGHLQPFKRFLWKA
ncbi:hypothetical protein TNCT_101851 [Trichonephila clavata]|uniref:Uncharacterized protein n=1 Tax=Trichonephila clavata TaxID=2740835 RepID=A0A8X6HQV6_TRICU|nr:hypothetical protein TNCT_101851 [Trichonephila clavata]